MNDTDFTGKTVLVVGGSSGIGNGIAHGFRMRGAEVHVWGTRASASDYSPEEGSDLAGLTYARVDVGDQAQIDAHVPPFDTLDVLVLAQGIVVYNQGEFEMTNFRKVVDVNLSSVMACAVKFHPILKAAKGSLITVSSTSAYHSTRGNPAYGASKAAEVGLTRTLGEAWARDGIRVNGLAPGYVETKLTKVTFDDPARAEGAIKRIPQRRIGTPADMAGAAIFLASPLASYICGQTIIVDGGLTL